MAKVITARQGSIFIVTINRPETKNAVDAESADLLFAAFSEFEKNDELYVAILTGTGDVFCSGADLKSIAADEGEEPTLTKEGNAPLGISRMALSKPVIAAVEGYAVAGGLELALWCDLRVASYDAVFGVYCRRFGVPLVDGGTIRLPRLIGHSKAMDMILTGRGVNGDEALQFGLANRIVENGMAFDAALALAESLSKLPQTCMRSDRLSAIEQWDLNISDALANETQRGLKVIQSGETLSGAIKFSKKEF